MKILITHTITNEEVILESENIRNELFEFINDYLSNDVNFVDDLINEIYDLWKIETGDNTIFFAPSEILSKCDSILYDKISNDLLNSEINGIVSDILYDLEHFENLAEWDNFSFKEI